ncbi:EAL domain-containing protein [Methylocystis heyeri]|nr:EAL domain-containing protein [Methylocystis heyeri]
MEIPDLKSFFELTPAAVAVFDRDLRCLAASPAWRREPRLGSDALGGGLFESRPDLGEKFRGDLERGLRDDEAAALEFRLEPRPGELPGLRAKVCPWRRSDGDLGGVVVFAEETAQEEPTRKALAESEERFHGLLEKYSQAIWEADRHGQTVSDSPSWRAYTGQTLEEMLGHGWLDAVHPDDRARVQQTWREAMASRADVDVEARIRHADQGYRWTNARATAILDQDGEIEKWVGVNIDIDDRKKTEEALWERVECLRLAQSAANIATWDWHIHEDRTFVSDHYYRIYGIPENGAQDYASFLARIHPEDVKSVDAIMRTALARGGVDEAEFRIIREDDGSIRWVRSRGEVFLDEGGRARRALGVVFDITRYKEAEAAFLENERRVESLNRSLEKKVEERTRELREKAELLRRRKQALEDSERRFRLLADQSPTPISICDSDDTVAYVNPGFTRAYGYRLEDIPTLALWFSKAYPQEFDRDYAERKWIAHISRAREEKTAMEPLETRIRCSDGRNRTVVIATNFLDDSRTSFMATFFDVTEARAEEERIKRLSKLYAALSGCQEAVVHAKTKQEIFTRVCDVMCNQGVAKLVCVGVREDSSPLVKMIQASGQGVSYAEDITISTDPSDVHGQGPTGTAFREGVAVWCQDFAKDPQTAPWRERGKKYGWRSSAGLPLFEKGRVAGVLIIYFDTPDYFDDEIRALLLKISESVSFALDSLAEQAAHEAAVREIELLAHFDTLTGLPNRNSLLESLGGLISRYRDCADSTFALHLIDLDNFKDINDTLGHILGDRFLATVGKRLSSCVRRDDIVCRIGGDEFVVIQLDVRDGKEAEGLAGKLTAALAEPYAIGEIRLLSSGTVGIAIFGPESPSAELLLSHADVALYRAKERRRGTFAVFTRQMDCEVRSRVDLLNQLREAVDKNQLFLCYQPQFEIDGKRITGVEALVRWLHPVEGVVGPGRFIPVAEDSGLIIEIGDWVLNEATRQMAAWIEHGIAPPSIAINVSAHQLKKQIDFAARLASILRARGVQADRVEIEMTESVLIDIPKTEDNVINSIRALGAKIALDDFGTGYSSLDYLSKFPVDRIKIAQQFVVDILASSRSRAVVDATITLAQRLGMRVIAEGTETSRQLDILKKGGCREFQGYYFSRPLSPAMMTRMLSLESFRPRHESRLELKVAV